MTSHHPNTVENQSLVIAGDEALRGGPTGNSGNDNDMAMEAEAEEGLESDGFRSDIILVQVYLFFFLFFFETF